MLDEELFNALKEIEASNKGGLCILQPVSQSDEERKNFDDLVVRAYRLRELGYVEFMDGQVRKDHRTNAFRYAAMACHIKYEGKKALAFGTFDDYSKAEPTFRTIPVVQIDQSLTIQGNVSHSNIASHSSQTSQKQENSDLAQLFNEIIKALKADTSIPHQERQEKLDDVEMLHKELQREKPRREIIQTLYSNLANTASIVSLMMQLQPFIQRMLS